MTPLIPALAGALIVAGFLGVVVGLQPQPPKQLAPVRRSKGRVVKRLLSFDRRTRVLAGGALVVGLVLAALTGWVIAIPLLPLAAIGLPTLLMAPAQAAQIQKLEALEEWARAMSGVLTVGVGLEEAIRTSLRSTPDAIRTEVATLVARLRARIGTEQALRAFADDLDDSTGDLVVGYLILGARRSGPGLASVLESLSMSMSEEVRGRRAIEADRAKPRSTARLVTIITLVVLVFLTFTGDYVEPYGSPIGQLLLVLFLSAYVALLVWMRSMARGEELPRFLGSAATEGAVP